MTHFWREEMHRAFKMEKKKFINSFDKNVTKIAVFVPWDDKTL